jgi:hypothetical protein
MSVLSKLFICAVTSFAMIQATEKESMFELNTYATEQIEPLLPLLQEWGEREFIQYPYLWVPEKGKIFASYALLARENNARMIIVKNRDQIIAVAAGVPFDAAELQSIFDDDAQSDTCLLAKVKEQGFDPSRMFYMSTFCTAPEFHNDSRLVDLIYQSYVDFIRSIGRDQICYFEDKGRPDHPLKPEVPIPIEPWGCVIQGFQNMQVKKTFSWPTLQADGSVQEEAHQLEFFVKNI